MPQSDVQKSVRELITETDQYSRHAHAEHRDAQSATFASIRTTLLRLDRWLGARTRRAGLIGELDLVYQRVRDASARATPEQRAEIEPLLGTAERLRAKVPDRAIASRPLLGVLPLARVVPQNVHSIMDYAVAAATASTVLFGRSVTARLVGATLGASGMSVAAMTDCELSAAKVIPIEAHEFIDYGWSLVAITAPFALGYWRRAPLVAAVQIACGVVTIAASLFTDYRASRGKRRARPRTMRELDARSVARGT